MDTKNKGLKLCEARADLINKMEQLNELLKQGYSLKICHQILEIKCSFSNFTRVLKNAGIKKIELSKILNPNNMATKPITQTTMKKEPYVPPRLTKEQIFGKKTETQTEIQSEDEIDDTEKVGFNYNPTPEEDELV